MQRYLLILLLSLLSTGLLRAQAHSEVDSTTYNFGTVTQGENPTHIFLIKNTGNVPLLLNNVEVSCGCLLVNYSMEPIKPGNTGQVHIMFVSGKRKGFQLRSTTVKTNADNREIVLYMKGTVVKTKK